MLNQLLSQTYQSIKQTSCERSECLTILCSILNDYKYVALCICSKITYFRLIMSISMHFDTI